jgi:hypothetical protein
VLFGYTKKGFPMLKGSKKIKTMLEQGSYSDLK